MIRRWLALLELAKCGSMLRQLLDHGCLCLLTRLPVTDLVPLIVLLHLVAGVARAKTAEGPLASTAACFTVQDEGLVVVRHKLVRRVLLHHVDSFDPLAIHIVAVNLVLALTADAVAIIVTFFI